MKLYKIDIERFRGFPKLRIEDFKDLNLIVGKNNCGKTSILEAIFLSIGVSNPILAINIDGFRGLIHDETDDFQFIFHNLDYSNNIKIDTEFVKGPQFRKLIIHPTFEKVKDIEVKQHDTSTNTNLLSKKIDGIEFDFSVKSLKQSKDNFKKTVLLFTNQGLKSIPPVGYNESILGIFLRPITTSSDVYERLDKILIKKGQERLIKALHHIDNRVADISLGAKKMIYFDIGIEKLVPIQIMGDGIIRLLSFLVTIANAENGVVLIDEIENGFHFSVLNKVWESIYDAAKLYNVQVFATTHSIECAKAFNKIQSSRLLKEDTLRVFRIEKNKGEFETFKYDSEILESSVESNWEIR
jgi:AAA15 family ATPase/GTPase